MRLTIFCFFLCRHFAEFELQHAVLAALGGIRNLNE
jgi:hypothetical protein